MRIINGVVKAVFVVSFIIFACSAVAGEEASMSLFRKADTTPPMLNKAFPAPDSTVKADTIVRAEFMDNGSDIDADTVRMILDGKDVSEEAEVWGEFWTGYKLTLRPKNPLAKGIHEVEVTVADTEGNVGNRLAWRFGVGTKVPLDIKLDKENGVFVVSGEPFFPVGLYCGATHPSSVREPLLAQAAAAGFNYQTVPDTTSKAGLDMMLKHGQKAVRKMNYTMWAYNKGDKSLLEEALKQKDHPAVLAWWTEFGAPRAKDITAMNPICKALRERDPEHPVLLMGCWAHAFDRLFVKSDIYWVYSYPINLTTTPARIDIMALWFQCLGPAFKSAATVGKGKPVWLVSQAFDYRINNSPGRQLIITPPDEFRPSPVELRAMNYLALAKGVRGLLFYAPGVPIKGTNKWNTVTYYSKPWNEVLRIAGEVRHLSPVLAVGKPMRTVSLQDEDENEAIHYLELRLGDTHTVIAVNAKREEVQVEWLFSKPAQVKVLFEDRELSEKANSMADTFKPLEVHVYQWELPAAEFAAIEGAVVAADVAPQPAPKRVRTKRAPIETVVVAEKAGLLPNIDGVLDEKCWAKAGTIKDFVVYETEEELALIQTQAKLVFASDAIYVGLRCDEPNVKGLLERCKNHDGDVWHDDCVEIWFDTTLDKASAYHLAINPLGTVYDERVWDEEVGDPQAGAEVKKKVRRSDVAWNSGCQVKVTKGKTFWTVEGRIPAKSLGVDKISLGSVWGLNVARVRRSGATLEMSSWTGVFTSPISGFGMVQLDQ